MEHQFVVTHTVHQTEIPALLDSWVRNTPSVKMLRPQKIACPYISVKTQHAEAFVCGGCQVFPSPVTPCISGLQQTAVSQAIQMNEIPRGCKRSTLPVA
jgi:hypothetical protein